MDRLGGPGSRPRLPAARRCRGSALRTRGWRDKPPAAVPPNGLKPGERGPCPPARPRSPAPPPRTGAQGGGLRSPQPLSHGFPSSCSGGEAPGAPCSQRSSWEHLDGTDCRNRPYIHVCKCICTNTHTRIYRTSAGRKGPCV